MVNVAYLAVLSPTEMMTSEAVAVVNSALALNETGRLKKPGYLSQRMDVLPRRA